MPTAEASHDAVVIGAGSGGLTVAVGLAGLGRRVALVEADRVGGDCTNVGCIPSKRLIHLSRDPVLREDPEGLFAAVRATRDGLAAREEREFGSWKGIELVRGRARLERGRRVTVEGPDGARELTARDVVIATGSRPRMVPVPGLPPDRLLTNETLWELRAAPRHLAIVGAGPIGVEMASAFRRIGSRVTITDSASRVLPQADPEASAALADALREQDVGLLLGTRLRGYEPRSQVLTFDDGAAVDAVDAVLVAVGREPVLDCAEGVVDADDHGIRVDAWGRTSVPGVWAVGDVTPVSHQTHGADAYARRVIQAIAFPWVPRIGRAPTIPSAVFSDPEVAWVGPTSEERGGHPHPEAVVRLRVDLADTDRGLTDGITRGFVAIDVVRLSGRVLGATLVGPRVSELLPLLSYAVAHRVSLLRLQRVVHAYPTIAGAIGRAADDFAVDTLTHLARELGGYGRYRVAAPVITVLRRAASHRDRRGANS
jgi:pyruvate/2-oxoglutarate dehydrogenase complex dihydrolipoamide dehydrogenase (E3) component